MCSKLLLCNVTFMSFELPLIRYFRQGCYIMPGVCLSVCLSVSNFTLITAERIFMKILPQMYLRIRKNWLNFGSHLAPDPDPGIFGRILQHCEIGHFSTVRLMSLDRAWVQPPWGTPSAHSSHPWSTFLQCNLVKCGIYYGKVCPSVTLVSQPCLNG